MGIFSKAYIKIDNINTVKNIIGKYHKVVNQEVGDVEKEWRFFENGSDTIILAKNYNENWVEIILNYQFTIYFHDEFLRRLSKDLETEILLGYYQSTDGTGRLAKFKKGELQLSIIQSHIDHKGESFVALMDNWGVTNELRSEFSIPNLNEPFFEIVWDSIYKFYKMNGLEWDGITRDDVFYHHLEIKY
ncbi:MAG: hypothetical protein RIR11_1588 [Bacteroidota bacterium]|jgi:hypothetical protein